jgi:hypothetical protein
LEQDEGTIVGQANLKVFITGYYRKLFGSPDPNSFGMIEDHIDVIPQLSKEEREILTTDFTEEMLEAITQMERNKAPGPDGLPVEFYQTFWAVIKGDIMAMFAQLQTGDLSLFRLNFGVITLLPKKEEASRIE